MRALQGFQMAIGRLGIAMLGMLATPLFTRVLPSDEYGRLALAIAIAVIASTAPTQWLTVSLLRFGPSTTVASLRRRLSIGLPLSCAPGCAIAAFGGMWLFYGDPLFIAILVIYALVESGFTTLWMAARAKLSLGAFILGGVARNAFALVLVSLWSLGHNADATAVLLCMVISSFLAVLVLIRPLRENEGATESAPPLAAWLRYGWPMVLNYLFTYCLMYADRFIIAHNDGEASAGTYAATYDLLYAMITLPASLVGLALVPKLFGTKDPATRNSALSRLRWQTLACVTPVLAVILISWPYLSRILIGADVRNDDMRIATALAVSFAVSSFRFQYFNIVLQMYLSTKALTGITAIALMLNIPLNLILVPQYGMVAAAVTSLASALVGTLCAGALSVRLRRRELSTPPFHEGVLR